MNYAVPTPSLCDNCTFAYFLDGGEVITVGGIFRQRYCAIHKTLGEITTSGYSSCPTNLPKGLPDGADRDIKCIAIQIHGKHPDKTADQAIAEVVGAQELRGAPDMIEKFRAALTVVKEDVAKIPLTRTL